MTYNFEGKRIAPEKLLGQTIREERSGFQGAVLATVHTYDSFGRLVSTVADYEPTVEYTYDALGNRVATTRSADNQWRKNETISPFVLNDAIIWLIQTNIVSCSDITIAPLVSSYARQLIGLTPSFPSRSRSTDVRSNVSENEILINSPFVVSRQTVLYATNKPLTLSRYGVELQTVSVSAVTNTVAYDHLGRQIANTDGRGNTSRIEYNALGQRIASIDALGNRTIYKYDQFGNLTSVINPLGSAIVYEYDLRGRKTYEGGTTYPVRYTYDVFGNKTTMTTYRDEVGSQSFATAPQGDVTTWLYDVASGSMTNKVYADGKGSTYSYTTDGKIAQRIWAHGIITDYAYDGWNNLTNTMYSDGTPTISVAYDTLGRQIESHDAAGVTTFAYDSFGSLTNEKVTGVAGTNTIIRHWDSFGRSLGYELNGVRQTTLAYGSATARIETMLTNGSDTPFTWSYYPGSDLKASLAYPNGLAASWAYDSNGQLLQVCNAFPTNTISQYDYTYDAVGRRVSCAKTGSAFTQDDSIAYGYNNRSELTNATAAADSAYRYGYRFDEVGNRETSFERGTNSVYTANSLNQYTEISDSALSASPRETFTPTYDDDGNQTLIKTATGVWSVTYNGENRPVQWYNGTTNITIKFDRMGRRVEYLETVDNATNTHHRFVYDGYLCIQRLNAAANNSIDLIFAWDPAEPVATRPLMIEKSGVCTLHVTHDGNKNVSDLVFFNGGSGVAAHYEYAPFGALTASTPNSTSTAYDFRTYNPFRFSSEYADDVLGLVYYNYRHYEPMTGRWLSRDPIEGLSRAIPNGLFDEDRESYRKYNVWLTRFMKLAYRYGDEEGYNKAINEYIESMSRDPYKDEVSPTASVNLYCQVENLTTLKVDVLGLSAFTVAAPVAGACALADGLLPFGEIVGLGIIVCCAIADAPPISIPNCPPPPLPPPPQIHLVPNKHGCPYGHWHYFMYHQAPCPLCINRLQRHFGGCIPPKAGQPTPPSFREWSGSCLM